MSEIKKKLVLIDSNALMHRAYHAIPPLTDKNGQVVNAVYGFTALLLKIMKDFSPDYIACTFDLAAPTFRHNEYEDYKAKRVKAPEEFYTQIPKIKEIIGAFGFPIYALEGFEADDIIGTIAHEAPKIFGALPHEIIILTGDLDTLQLVNGSVKVFTFKKGISDTVLYDEAAVKERYNLSAAQMVDFKGLRGDPSDNIPGVRGIGEKTAIKLLEDFGSIDYIYAHLDEVKAKVKPAVFKKLEESKEQAIFSKYLATIRLDAPINFDLETARVKNYDRAKIIKLFQELNFFSLIKRLNEPKDLLTYGQNQSVAGGESEKPVEKITKREVKNIGSEEEIKEMVEKIRKQESFSFDIKFEFKDFKYSILTLGIAINTNVWEINMAGLVGDSLKEIKNIFEDRELKKIGHDIKMSIKVFRYLDIKLENYEFDTMIGAYLLNPGKRDYGLEKIVFEYMGTEPASGGSAEGGKDGEGIGLRAVEILALSGVLKKNLEAKKNTDLAEKIEFPLINILAEMEIKGAKIDTERLESMALKIAARIDKLKKEIYALAGEEFNINSTRELAKILFEKLEIPANGVKKTKTDYSTAADTLSHIKELHPIVKFIIQYRELSKINSTYAEALPKLVNPRTGRIHTTFNQALTATGRLSSSDPNFQNIPIKTEIGNEIRMAFVPPAEDWELLSFDYSQIELRIVASMANDRKMLGIFSDGGDIHRQTAAEVYEVAPDKVMDKMRSEAKALNFGIIYGMSVHGFAEATGVSREEARVFIEKYLLKFSGIDRFRGELMAEAKAKGYAQTIFGRRRLLPELKSPNFQVRAAAERMAINMPIQGTAADIIKLAMIAVDKKYGAEKDINLILQVHDELVFEVQKEKSDIYAKEIKSIMENVYMFKVPLVVSASRGENWGEMSAV